MSGFLFLVIETSLALQYSKLLAVKTSLEHLPEHKQAQLKEITEIIVGAVDPEKVILFGSHATGRWVEDRFTEGHITYEYVSDYDLLVITKADEKRKDYEIQDIIENRCRYKTPVNAITHNIGYINKHLSEGQYFFSDIEKEGIMLYDAGNVPLAERRQLNPSEAKALAQADYDKWFISAVNFLGMSVYAKQNGTLKESAFVLHQAAERTYHAIILVFTGYKPKTHNLDKLIRYTKRYSVELAGVFPRNSELEAHLFDLLLKGYIDARYKDDYVITTDELTRLIERVRKLQAIAERICKEKIASFNMLE